MDYFHKGNVPALILTLPVFERVRFGELRNETKQQTLAGYCNDCHVNSGVAAVNIEIRE